MTLRPKDTVHKALLSTTSRLVGEYEGTGVLLTHAWPDLFDQSASARWADSPSSRSAFILVFETKPSEEASSPLLNYSPTSEIVCAYLAVLFGKRFDSHGMIESNGFFHLPELSQFRNLCNPRIPHNSHAPRVDYPVPLNLTELRRIEKLLYDPTLDTKFFRTFRSASKFYLQAIQNAEIDPEIAYLHLITAGEILSNFYDYDKHELIDEQTQEILSDIRDGMANGPKIANNLAGKFLLVKRRFVKTIVELVDPDFFRRSEAYQSLGGFRADTFRSCIGAAYDLRSRYIHTGIPFGNWVSLDVGKINNETQLGRPVVDDRELQAILAKAPTYIGLERVIRYCLLQFAKAYGAYVEPAAADGANKQAAGRTEECG